MLTQEIVEQTALRCGHMNGTQWQAMIVQMQREQPAVMTYLESIRHGQMFSQPEGETVFHIGVVVWQMIRQSPQGLREVDAQELVNVMQEDMSTRMTMLSDTPADLMAATKSMIERCPEPEVLRYIVSVIEYPLELESEGPSFTEKNKMFAALFLQLLMNALVKGLN